jgi:hypothetical protein
VSKTDGETDVAEGGGTGFNTGDGRDDFLFLKNMLQVFILDFL